MLLTIRGQARSLLSIAPIQNGRLQVIRRFPLGHNATGGDMFATQPYPDIAHMQRACRPRTQKGDEFTFTSVNECLYN